MSSETLNINLNTAPVALASEDPPISTPLQTPRRSVSAVRRSEITLRRSARHTTPYSRPMPGRLPSETPQLRSIVKTTTGTSQNEIPETPLGSQYDLLSNAPPGDPSDEHLPQLRFDASPTKSDSSVTESDSSFTDTEETPHALSPGNALFSVTESQVDACFSPGYFERCTERALRACIEFSKEEEEEGSQE
ncbi:hypothetical protein GGX14DRAFT_406588 [Mycena pura]|uniref:Uncharacterized protein n=1 Tax=Mycena pura TaxID=153505 RepID=A0AAD6Y355_9AGAR|nr:hypothetical protein GGX14DRAFT_406588 [Mycena pura]